MSEPEQIRLIPCELLRTGKRQRRSGSPRTCPCPPLPSHCPWQWLMRDIHSRTFRIRYTSLCQRLLPTRSLHRIYFPGRQKKGFYYELPIRVASGEERFSVLRLRAKVRGVRGNGRNTSAFFDFE